MLDQKSSVVRKWFHLGQQFKLSNETLKEIEYGPLSPTEVPVFKENRFDYWDVL